MVDWVCGSLIPLHHLTTLLRRLGLQMMSFTQDGSGHTEMYSLHFSIVEGSRDASSISCYSLWPFRGFRCKHALLVLISPLFTAIQSKHCWSNWITRDIGLFRLRGSVRHIYKMNNLSNLWTSSYWRCKPFQTIQFDLMNWFDWFTKNPRLNRTVHSRTGHHL